MASPHPFELTPAMLWAIILVVSLLAFFLAFLLWKLISENPCIEIPILGIKKSGCVDASRSGSINWMIASFEKIEGTSKELLGEIVFAPGDAPPPAEDHKNYGPVFGFKNDEFTWWAYAESNDAIFIYGRNIQLALRVTPTKDPGTWEGIMNNSRYRISALYPAEDLVAQGIRSWGLEFAQN